MALSIIRKWRAQKLEDEERTLLQERLFNAEEHFRSMGAVSRVSNMEAEAHYLRMKNARADLVGRSENLFCLDSCSLAYMRRRMSLFNNRRVGGNQESSGCGR